MAQQLKLVKVSDKIIVALLNNWTLFQLIFLNIDFYYVKFRYRHRHILYYNNCFKHYILLFFLI